MVESADHAEGRCMCGAVNFRTTGRPSRVLHCHCHSCRHHTGAPMATLAVYRMDQVTFAGTPRKAYQSAPGVHRSFCAHCGSSLTWETNFADEGPLCAIHISAFDVPETLIPNAHSFYPERISWFDTHDNLPRHAEFVANSEPMQWGPTNGDTV